MTLPTHRERQLMQHLRHGGWVKATMLPSSPKVIANLVDKGWIERGSTDAEVAYRITEKGLAAKKAPVPIC
jgi:hypothetical protein